MCTRLLPALSMQCQRYDSLSCFQMTGTVSRSVFMPQSHVAQPSCHTMVTRQSNQHHWELSCTEVLRDHATHVRMLVNEEKASVLRCHRGSHVVIRSSLLDFAAGAGRLFSAEYQ